MLIPIEEALTQIEDALPIAQVAVVGARSCCCVCCTCLCYLFANIVRFQGDVNLRAAMFVRVCYVFVGLSVCMRVVAFVCVCWFERVHVCCCVVVLLCC